jgi:thiamine pyrophosphate-dependent acetolactate synthase large subunit-like protein
MRNRAPENRWIGQRIDDPEVDIAEYAAALGIKSAGPVTKVGELIPAIEAALKIVEAGGPFVLNVHVQKGYAVPPPAREA